MMTEVVGPTVGPGTDAGDVRDPLRALYEAHYADMVRLAAALLGHPGAAEDVVQEAFLAVDRRLAGVPPAARVAYLRSAVMNGARSSLRRAGASKRRPVLTREAPSGTAPDEAAVRRDQHDRVVVALDRLPFRQRQCLVLRYFGGLADREVAETLGISLGSAKTHLRRGLDALHTSLGDLR